MKQRNIIRRLCLIVWLLSAVFGLRAATTKTFTVGNGTLNGEPISGIGTNNASVTVDGFQFTFTGSSNIVTDYYGGGIYRIGVRYSGTTTMHITSPSGTIMERVVLKECKDWSTSPPRYENKATWNPGSNVVENSVIGY